MEYVPNVGIMNGSVSDQKIDTYNITNKSVHEVAYYVTQWVISKTRPSSRYISDKYNFKGESKL